MRQSERAGLLYALIGFSTLSIGDALIKSMAEMWPPTAMIAYRYVLAAVFLSAVMAARHGVRSVWDMPKPGLQWLRGAGVAFAGIAMFTAVWLMPLGEATAIIFMQPMITAFLAAVFLGERLRFAAVLATIVAFGGVIIVLRPNVAEIGLVAFLPLVSAFFMALLVIANRASAGAASAFAMQVYVANTGSVILIIATIVGHFSGAERFAMHWPEWIVVAKCSVIAVTATLAHWFIYMGTVRAGASTVSPMTYGQLLTAVILGWIFFAEVPDIMAMIGAGIIVLSGLFLWYESRKRDLDQKAKEELAD